MMERPAFQIERFPVTGPVWFSNKGFYERRGVKKLRHCAIDIFGRRHEDVIAPTDIRITEYGTSPKGGNYVKAIDRNGYSYYFAHLDEVFQIIPSIIMYPNDANDVWISAGHVIGKMGNSGNAKTTRCHCHYQVKYRKSYVDPAKELIRTLKLEGRGKEPSHCKKTESKCEWCRA